MTIIGYNNFEIKFRSIFSGHKVFKPSFRVISDPPDILVSRPGFLAGEAPQIVFPAQMRQRQADDFRFLFVGYGFVLLEGIRSECCFGMFFRVVSVVSCILRFLTCKS